MNKRWLLQTNPCLNCLAKLTVKEKEVNKSQEKMQAASLRKETTLTEGVSSRKVEAVEKENKILTPFLRQRAMHLGQLTFS